MPLFDLAKIRAEFPALAQKVNGHPLVYLDNAATTQKPQVVLDRLLSHYIDDNANVHRSIYAMGERATKAYENARDKVTRFINAGDRRSIVFTSGTTAAINLVAYSWARRNLKPGDEIVVTEMEHHSNLVPWQMAARDSGAVLRYIPLRDDLKLDMDQAREIIGPRTRLVAVVHKSNVLGVVNPVEELISLAHERGALILLDGAQAAPHIPVNVQTLDCDFYAFSGHKMLGPTGVGVLFAKPELLQSMEPFLGGGEMISSVSMEDAQWNDIPWKFEAGTPNIAQAVGLGAAIDYINAVGLDAIHIHVQNLTNYARSVIGGLAGVTIHAPDGADGALPFTTTVHPHDLAQLLDQYGIAVRAGHHCAQPLTVRMGVAATNRASFYLYNTYAEIDALAEGILRSIRFMSGGG